MQEVVAIGSTGIGRMASRDVVNIRLLWDDETVRQNAFCNHAAGAV